MNKAIVKNQAKRQILNLSTCFGITIPKEFADAAGLKKGRLATLTFDPKKKTITISK